SLPPLTTTAGLTYRYDVVATDPDGDPLSYTVTSGPAGMTIDALGRLSWPAGSADIGDHPVVLTLADNQGASTPQSFTLHVLADTEAPKVNLIISPTNPNVGDTATFVVSATDNVGVATLALTVNGT